MLIEVTESNCYQFGVTRGRTDRETFRQCALKLEFHRTDTDTDTDTDINFVNVYTITYRVQYTFTRVHARIHNGHAREDLREESARVGQVGGQVGKDRRACPARGKLNGEVAGGRTRRHLRDDPRAEVGEEVRVGIRVGAVECQLYRLYRDNNSNEPSLSALNEVTYRTDPWLRTRHKARAASTARGPISAQSGNSGIAADRRQRPVPLARVSSGVGRSFRG